MRRILSLCTALLFLTFPVRAARQPRYAALIIDSGSNGKYTRQLLDGLYDRGLQATFLLQGNKLENSDSLAQQIWEEGHEIAYHGYSGQNMTRMSRRSIAQELMDTQALLPEACKPKFLCPPGGCGDGVRQVAQVRGLGILNWSISPGNRSLAEDVFGQVQDGDLICLRDTTQLSVQAALSLIDRLMEADYQLCTVSQLAKTRNVRIQPGKIYSCFPPESAQ